MHPLVRRQLRKALGTDVPQSAELLAFAEAVGAAYAAADEDRQQLERSLELASAELYDRNRAMALILDHVAQGFVTVGLDGTPSHECSRALVAWFGPLTAGVTLWDYLLPHDVELAAWMQLAFDSLQAGIVPAEIVVAQLPAELARDGRRFRAEYRSIGEPVTALLVVITDITDELARQQAERQQRELLEVVERVGRDRAGFLAFLRSTDLLIEEARRTTATVDELCRTIHTLKGNAALFGVGTVAEVCHALESQILEAEVAPDPASRAHLFEVWGAFRQRVGHLLDLSERDLVIIDRADYREVVAMLGERDVAWARRIRQWGQDPTRAHLERLGDQARQLAERLGKAELDVEIRDNGACVDRERFASVWAALVHAVRNAVDHGLETREQRIEEGKPEHGHLALRTQVTGDALIVEIEDDGAGIDLAAVSARAAALGHAVAGAEAVFVAGVSTAAEVTDVSGRGIGMGALRAACAELGGRVDLASVPHAGTTVRCVIPLVPTRASGPIELRT